jgi:hypothetical protein
MTVVRYHANPQTRFFSKRRIIGGACDPDLSRDSICGSLDQVQEVSENLVKYTNLFYVDLSLS